MYSVCHHKGRFLKQDCFEIYILSRDHTPAHIHVCFPKKNNMAGFIKLNLNNLEIMELENISRKDSEKLMRFLSKDRLEILTSEWEKFHD